MTLLLDEIGDVPAVMQVELLRVLQEREVRRVGENRTRAINVRVLAATNRDLLADVHAARFRQDRYYRLRVVEIVVPPLHERRDDLLPLARLLLAAAAKRFGKKAPALTPEAANLFLRYAWPGNVRELENALERAIALARSERIGVDDLPPEIGTTVPTAALTGEDARTLAEVERDYIWCFAARFRWQPRQGRGATGHRCRDPVPEVETGTLVGQGVRLTPVSPHLTAHDRRYGREHKDDEALRHVEAGPGRNQRDGHDTLCRGQSEVLIALMSSV